ncbi:MAG: polysaccharide biosynthesis protein, partial [Syntrophomonas sp.]
MRFFSLRTITMLLIDALLVNIAVYSALLLRFEGAIPLQYSTAFLSLIPVLTGVNLLFMVIFKLYNRMWNYASIGELSSI